jgi:hypothetical protein
VSPARRCSRTACRRPAVATLTYVYGDQTAVLGPLATYAEPHAYDLCEEHSERLSAPRGWEVMRLAPDPDALGPSTDDLLALADAVREAARPAPTPPPVSAVPGAVPGRLASGGRAAGGTDASPDRPGHPAPETGRRGHLRVLRPLSD